MAKPKDETQESKPKREKLPSTPLVQSATKIAKLEKELKKLEPKVKRYADVQAELSAERAIMQGLIQS